MNPIKKNLAANIVSFTFTPAATLVCVPVFKERLGIEGFGLIGFFVTLYAVLNPLCAALNMAMNREMARLSAHRDDWPKMRDLLRTLEVVYWALTAALGLAVIVASPLVAGWWLRPENLSTETVRIAVLLMGVTLTLQLPNALYTAGFNGLQCQVQLAAINIVMNGLRLGGTVAALVVFPPTIELFFLCQIAFGSVHTLLLRVLLGRMLPGEGGRASFRIGIVRRVWRFVVGSAGISVAAVVLTQTDKIILSKILYLEGLGYYALAQTAALGLTCITGAAFTAFSPRLAQLVKLDDRLGLARTYHFGCQLIAAALTGAAAVVVIFPREVLAVWTGDRQTVEAVWPILALLATGTTLNGLVNLPYALQLAHGWTRLALTMNVISIAVLVPLIFVLTHFYKGVGAAMAWVILNSAYLAIGVTLTHRRLLPGQNARWFLVDTLPPVAAALAAAGLARLFIPRDVGRIELGVALMAVGAMAVVVAGLSASELRMALYRSILQRTSGPPPGTTSARD